MKLELQLQRGAGIRSIVWSQRWEVILIGAGVLQEDGS